MAEVFQPIRGLEENINKIPVIDGNVYFAYDTGNIYLDKNQRRHLMGGSSNGIFYTKGNDSQILKINPDDEKDFKYKVLFSALEDESIIPVPNSLLLNSDGRFFRVLSVDNNTFSLDTLLLAVSGTGSGGGAPIIVYSDRPKLIKKDPESRYLINGKEAYIQLYAVSGRENDGSFLDESLEIYWTLSERTETGILSQYASNHFSIQGTTDENNPIYENFEYGSKARHSTTNVLTLYVKGSSENISREIAYEFYTSDLQLLKHSNFNNINIYTPDDVTIYCSAMGDVEKIIFYYFESNGEMVCLNPNGTKLLSGTNEPSYTVPQDLATHGSHKVRIELYQYINGKPDFTSSATPLEMEIGINDTNVQKPIIWLGDYKSEYYQYDSIKIPFRVYDPKNSLSTTITLFKDSTKIGTRTITDSTSFSIWEIINADLNAQNYYTIACGEEDNEVRREISFLVSEDPTRVGMKIAEAGLRYSFDASGRSNSESEATRDKYIYKKDDIIIESKFENFNWYNNGWVLDDVGNTCLRISNGAKFTIPLKQTKFATQNASSQSHTFEFQFKVRNVQDYSQIIHNVTRYKSNSEASHGRTFGSWTDDTVYKDAPSVYKAYMNRTYLDWSDGRIYDNYDAFLQWYLPEFATHYPELLDPTQQIFPVSYDDLEFRKVEKILNTGYASGKYYDGTHGICIGAQDALFTNGTDTVNVAYVEDKLINLTVVYSHGNGENGGSNKLMSIYLNGMLTGVTRSTTDGAWNIGENDDISIIFDSQYCDFDLYKIRVYNQGLTLSSIVTNYMVDLKDPIGYDLSQLAVLNNSLNESQFVYSNMINYNNSHPDGYIMPYIIFTTNPTSKNTLPYSKQTPIPDVTIEFVNTGLDRAYTLGELNELAERAGQTVEEYYMHHCPSWKGENIAMSVQGTSSEFYPRRNYKAKTKNLDNPYEEESDSNKKTVHMYMNRGPFAQQYVEDKNSTHLDWFYMDNDTVGTTKFTLKIDYMESSGTYNMGFANLVKNAYSHHPYYDYLKAGAFQKEVSTYEVASSYEEGKTYYYKNHKGNWKNTDEDELNIFNDEEDKAAAWALGPYDYGISKGISKVNANDNNWYVAVISYEDLELDDIKYSDLRTSVQGFPVLAFHQKTDENGNNIGTPLYIGRYNMLLDKGSDEAYGFKMDGVYQKFVQKKGKPQKISKVAECWEGENNSRGFCSFRDAATNRAEDDDRFFDTDKLTSYGAPVVADYWEYRYHDKADSLDVIYELNTNINNNKPGGAIDVVLDELGVDISNPNAATHKDPSYKGIYTEGMRQAGEKMLEIYSNWEKAVRWVYSTDQDSVPSSGTYTIADVGEEIYEPNKYYVSTIQDNVLIYSIDESETYDKKKTYYIVEDANENSYKVIKLCENEELKYAPNKFYIKSGLGDYVLDSQSEGQNIEEKVFDPDIEYYYLDNDEANSGAKQLENPVEYNGITYNYDTKEYRNAKFVNDLTKHFNLEYLVTYFIMTEVFECYDSRGKNMMMASWGPQEEDGEYIWYPIFYDIDTQLGINNTGIPSFEYYVDATEDGTFSTNDSILFNNLYRNFKGAIVQKYKNLRGAESNYTRLKVPPLESIERIEKWYLGDPVECNSIAMRGERPLIALNLDEYYKYITITNPQAGYQNREGIWKSEPDGAYFYMLQGNRSLSRQQFLTNRLNYIDSWLGEGQYKRGGSNAIKGRISANRPSVQSDKWIEGNNVGTEAANIIPGTSYWQDEAETIKTHMFDGEYWVDMEPVRNSYVTMGTDAANFPSQKYVNTEGPVHFIATDLENAVRKSGGYAEQLLYIYGIDQMKSLGDMSKLYWTELEFQTNAKKLTELLLGYDGVDESFPEDGDPFDVKYHYHHNGVNLYTLSASIEGGGMPLLKKANLSYITFNNESPTFNFNSCEKLADFRAIGSNITNVIFAPGVALHTLYLPETITTLNLTEATQLKNIVTKFVTRDDRRQVDVTKGLYIHGLTDADPSTASSNINTININGDYLGYDSYKLLNNYYSARSGANASYITITNVNWSPYKQLTKGFEYNETDAEAGLYFIDNGHYSFDAYTKAQYNEKDWNLKIQNGELYKLDKTVDASVIKDATLLENLKTNPKFFSTVVENNAIPIISGIIYIDNDVAVNEKDIEISLDLAYPDLHFFFKNVEKVPSAKYVILNDDGTYDLLARRSLGENESYFPNPNSIVSSTLLNNYDTRSQYDFYGWSEKPLSPQALIDMDNEEWYLEDNMLITTTTDENILPLEYQHDNWANQQLITDKNDYIFYAVYYIHKYQMTYLDGNQNEIAKTYVPANSFILDYLPEVIPGKDDSALSLESTYAWTGWKEIRKDADLIEQELEPDFSEDNKNEKKTTIGRASKNRTFIATFKETSVYENVLPEKYFERYGSAFNLIRTDLKGKITIPKSINNINITTFNNYGNSGWRENSEVTHVFFEKGSTVNIIGAHAFQNWSSLQYVKLPNIIQNDKTVMIEIRDYAFANTISMFKNISPDDIDIFFSKIAKIGSNAFYSSSCDGINFATSGNLKSQTIRLPYITDMGENAFQAILVDKIEIGTINNPIDCSNWLKPFIHCRKNTTLTGNIFPDVTYYRGNLNSMNKEELNQILFGVDYMENENTVIIRD